MATNQVEGRDNPGSLAAVARPRAAEIERDRGPALTRATLIRDLSVVLLVLPVVFLTVSIFGPGDLVSVVLLLVVSSLLCGWFAWRVRRWQGQARDPRPSPEDNHGA